MLKFDTKNHFAASHTNNTPCMTLCARKIIWIIVPQTSTVRILQCIGGNWTQIGRTLVRVSGHNNVVSSLSIYSNVTDIDVSSTTIE